MSNKDYTVTSIPKQQEPTLPSVRLGQLKGSDNSAVSIGEEALHLRVEYREVEWQSYRLIDLRRSASKSSTPNNMDKIRKMLSKPCAKSPERS